MGRKALWITLAMTLILVVGAWPAYAAAGDGIFGSPHDFTTQQWYIDDTDPGTDGPYNDVEGGSHQRPYQANNLCRVCHKPHYGMNADQGLLWNHALSTATYTMYDSSWSASIDGPQDPQPSGVSRLCLGCHDGTVALESWDGVTAPVTSTTIDTINAHSSLGTDLRITHPISIQYEGNGDTFLNPSSNTFSTGPSIADVLDVGGKMQCHSCHDVHNQEVTSDHMLTRDSGHDLCLTCHIK